MSIFGRSSLDAGSTIHLFAGASLFTQRLKCMFLYSSVSSPLGRSKAFTLHPWQTCTTPELGLSGKHSAMLQQLHEDYSLTFPPPSTARYSFIQLSELGRRGRNKNAKALKQLQRGFEARFSRFRVRHSSAKLRRSMCQPLSDVKLHCYL